MIGPTRVLGALLLLLATVVVGAAPVKLYVAPTGNDAWSGRLLATKGQDGPFATLTRARDEARKLLAAGQAGGGLTVFVRGGTYELAAPLSLGAEDSGTKAAPVVWRAYEQEKPRLVGSVKITGFQPWKGKILVADLKGTPLEKVAFRQLFFGDKRQVMARYPNVDPQDPHFGAWAYLLAADPDPDHKQGSVSDNLAQTKDHFTATADVIKDWTNVTDAEVCIHPAYGWAWNTVPIKSADKATGLISLAGKVSYGLMVGDRFFVQNLLEELDAPGEWYLDRRTAKLYYWPAADLNQGEVRAAVTQALIDLQGAHDVTVRGFTLEQCAGDAVTLNNCESCVIGQSTIRNTGKWAVVITGGHHTGASGNDIYATGAGGVNLSGGDRKTLERGDNYATNNYIHHIAAFYRTYNTGVNINGVGNLCSHNLIHDCYHQAILMGGNDNTVEYNNVHHTNLGSEDTGCLYMSSRDWTMRGNVIRYNIFHHPGGFGKDSSWQPVKNGRVGYHYPGFTWSIYLDAPESGCLIFGNVLYGIQTTGMFNHSGRDNVWENNILVDGPAFYASAWNEKGLFDYTWIHFKEFQANGTLPTYLAHYPDLAKYREDTPRYYTMFNCRFVRNIMYYSEASAARREAQKREWGGGQLITTYRGHKDDFGEFTFDYNCVFAPPGVEPKINLTLMPEPGKLVGWEEWRKLGKDEHSIFADPLFVNPAKQDFRLKPGSPALALGFKPIPFEQIGPYKDDLRATWPVVEAPGVSALGELTTQRYFQLPGYEPVTPKEIVPRGGLPNFFAKAKAGQPVTIVSFAGGNHQQGGWLPEVMKWLRAQYPAVKFTEVNATIDGGARGSSMSIYRLGYEVLRQQPDLVVVDFSADDGDSADQSLYPIYEGIIRQIWAANPATDLLFTHSFRLTYEQPYAERQAPAPVTVAEHLADYYGFPTINLGLRLAKLATAGQVALKASREEAAKLGKPVFTHDGVYVTPAANTLYAQFLEEGLAQLAAVGVAGPHVLKPAREPRPLDQARQYPITQAMLSGSWEKVAPASIGGSFTQHFAEVWVTKTPGAKLTFRFKGTEASLFDLMGPDTGRVQVTVDGKDAGIRQQVDMWCHYQRLSSLPLAQGLADTEHTITIELLPDPPDRSAPIAEAKRLGKYTPEAFAGVALRLGWIRVNGEVR